MTVTTLFAPLAVIAGVITAAPCYAAAPEGSTGECKDDSYTSAKSKSGACSGHGGVKDWYPSENQASRGGSAGRVWVNNETKVYHCSGDRWYGKTQKGEYMSEAAAKAEGYHADHGKTCN